MTFISNLDINTQVSKQQCFSVLMPSLLLQIIFDGRGITHFFHFIKCNIHLGISITLLIYNRSVPTSDREKKNGLQWSQPIPQPQAAPGSQWFTHTHTPRLPAYLRIARLPRPVGPRFPTRALKLWRQAASHEPRLLAGPAKPTTTNPGF